MQRAAADGVLRFAGAPPAGDHAFHVVAHEGEGPHPLLALGVQRQEAGHHGVRAAVAVAQRATGAKAVVAGVPALVEPENGCRIERNVDRIVADALLQRRQQHFGAASLRVVVVRQREPAHHRDGHRAAANGGVAPEGGQAGEDGVEAAAKGDEGDGGEVHRVPDAAERVEAQGGRGDGHRDGQDEQRGHHAAALAPPSEGRRGDERHQSNGRDGGRDVVSEEAPSLLGRELRQRRQVAGFAFVEVVQWHPAIGFLLHGRDALVAQGEGVSEPTTDRERRARGDEPGTLLEPAGERSAARGHRMGKEQGGEGGDAEQREAVLQERSGEEDAAEQPRAAPAQHAQTADDHQHREQHVDGILAGVLRLAHRLHGHERQQRRDERRPTRHADPRQQEQHRGEGEDAAEGGCRPECGGRAVNALDEVQEQRMQDGRRAVRRRVGEHVGQSAAGVLGGDCLIQPEQRCIQVVKPQPRRGGEQDGGGTVVEGRLRCWALQHLGATRRQARHGVEQSCHRCEWLRGLARSESSVK